MKQLHILQVTVVSTFALFVVVGLVILFAFADRMDKFAQLCGILFPFFIAVIVPAMLGKPVTEGIRNLTGGRRVSPNGMTGVPGS
jgi:hypothetical protein